MRVFALFLLSLAPVLAQNAQISGIVKDTSNGVVPNAVVTAVSQNTGAERTVKANAEGLYNIVSLTPGPYRIRTSASGFQATQKDDVVLSVAEDGRLDFTLEVGRTEQSVTVTADAPPST